VGFNRRKPQERVKMYGVFRMKFSYISAGHRGDSHRHMLVTVGKVVDIHGSLKRESHIPRKAC
jgi:hypothetical protein